MSEFSRWMVLTLLALVAATASGKEPWELAWIEIRSPHFVVTSALSENRSIELIRDLERFRLGVQTVTNVGRFEERIPTKVYVLPSAIPKLGFRKNFTGFFRPGMRANYAVVRPTPGIALDDVLKHEYVHFLMHNRDSLSYPRWFDEGFAEVASTLTTSGDKIHYGQPDPNLVSWLPNSAWMPFEELLGTRSTSDIGTARTPMFYAQSWLLVHFLMFGRPQRDFAVDATSYLRQVESGNASSNAFEQAFGVPVEDLRKTLVRYLLHDIRSVALNNQTFADGPIAVAPVPADSVAAQLGLFPFQNGDFVEAKRYWDAAIALNPHNTEALTGLGDCLKEAGQFDEARPYYEKAIALEPENPYPELDYAEYFLARAEATKDPTEINHLLVEARRHLARSYKIDANVPETLATNGESYLFDGQSPDKAVESLREAHAMLPSQPYIKLKLAQAYARSGQPTEAIALLRSVVAWGHTEIAEEAAKALEAMPEYKASGSAAGGLPPSQPDGGSNHVRATL